MIDDESEGGDCGAQAEMNQEDSEQNEVDTITHTYTRTFIKEWQHKHAGFKTKHNAQSISQ